MELRPYQKKCLNNILWAEQNDLPGNSICMLPTGSGKSIIIAELARTLTHPILILQPTKEILEQNHEKLLQYVSEANVGIYSASMNQKIIKQYTFATIQSIYKKPEEFAHFGLVVIDECHLVNIKKQSSMYKKFLKDIGNPKVVGFTATPYRMDTSYYNFGQENERCETTIKLINRMRYKNDRGMFWKRILYHINVKELIDQEYLCPLEYFDEMIVDQKNLPLNVSRSDFDFAKLDKMIAHRDDKVLEVISRYQEISKSVLVFCSTVPQAERLASNTKGAEVVSAKTSKKDRERIIDDFKSHKIKTVYNVGVLTTGFDHPSLDCIVLLRPTSSIALYYQMIGRGLRIAPGKTSCKIVDMTSTVKVMGRVETIKVDKKSVRDRWELTSETGSWHNRELFAYYPQINYYRNSKYNRMLA